MTKVTPAVRRYTYVLRTGAANANLGLEHRQPASSMSHVRRKGAQEKRGPRYSYLRGAVAKKGKIYRVQVEPVFESIVATRYFNRKKKRFLHKNCTFYMYNIRYSSKMYFRQKNNIKRTSDKNR